jgi:hypothetical protein
MRRKLKNFKNKNGHSESAPRQLVDEAFYREHQNGLNVLANTGTDSPRWDFRYSGWSNGSRPRDQHITLRSVTPIEIIG